MRLEILRVLALRMPRELLRQPGLGLQLCFGIFMLSPPGLDCFDYTVVPSLSCMDGLLRFQFLDLIFRIILLCHVDLATLVKDIIRYRIFIVYLTQLTSPQ